jgi:hypothetical protein
MTQATSYMPARQPIRVEESKPNVLTTVIRRLEAATSRLEDIASTSVAFDAANPGQTAASSTPKSAESLPPSIQAFDKLIDTELKQWLELSAKLGDVINGQVRRAQRGFKNRSLTWDRQNMSRMLSRRRGSSCLPRPKQKSPISPHGRTSSKTSRKPWWMLRVPRRPVASRSLKTQFQWSPMASELWDGSRWMKVKARSLTNRSWSYSVEPRCTATRC